MWVYNTGISVSSWGEERPATLNKCSLLHHRGSHGPPTGVHSVSLSYVRSLPDRLLVYGGQPQVVRIDVQAGAIGKSSKYWHESRRNRQYNKSVVSDFHSRAFLIVHGEISQRTAA